MTYLQKKINYTSSFKRSISIGFILSVILSFIIIFLEPFDTNEYESGNRYLMLLGFGVLFFIYYIIHSALENLWYNQVDKIWTILHEVVSTVTFFTIVGTIIYLYNHLVVNNLDYTIQSHWWYYKNIVVVFIPIFAPIYVYLRHKFGERIVPLPENTITITGENKNEILILQKKQLYFIKAIENYIEIYYNNTNNEITSKTFRQTLSKAHRQIPFLEKCHRSYLFNIDNIDNIKGNSQNAKISFTHLEQMIPLSKTYYNNIKSKLSEES